MLNIPFCAYCVQISTTFLLSSTDAFSDAVELDVRLDELDRAIRAGRHRLRRRAGEPVDDRAAGDQAEQERRVQQRQLRHQVRRSAPRVSATMIEKIIVVAPTTAVPISTGLAVALNVLPAPSFSSSSSFALSNCTLRPKSFFSSCWMSGNAFDHRQLEHRLRVVGDRTVGVDGNRHRTHAEEAEGHEAEREHRRRQHQARTSTCPTSLTK